MGTSVHTFDLDLEKDFWGKENCTEVLVLARPDVVETIHGWFFEAGSDAVETNTFGGMPHVLQEFDLRDRCRELNREAVRIARRAAAAHATRDRPRYVVAATGPGTKLISLGHIDWDTLYASYHEQALGLLEGEPDAILLETQQDLLCIKCALNAVLDAMKEVGVQPAVNPGDEGLAIMVQVTIEQTGTMLAGTEIAAAAVALENYPIASLGMNCATGPADMAEHLRWLADYWPRHISVLPNAGLPSLVDGETVYPLRPDDFAKQMTGFVEDQGVAIVGGCCGTTPAHLRALCDAVGGREVAAHAKRPMPVGCTSLYGWTAYRQDASLLNVGERCNASGSRKFKRLLEEEDWDEIMSLGREQMKEGSHVLDVNVDYAGRDNAEDMATVVHGLVRQVDAPLMLDSTQPATIEAGLRQAGGKCLINSANLEDGEEKFAVMCELARRYNAGLVLGCIDEDPDEAMARTEARKLEIATRMHALATQKYGLREQDLMFDPLVLPVSTGMEKDKRSGLETINGTRAIAEAFPNCQITCGLSNVSFGLKPAARQVLNSAFLHELREAGMTSAIVHVSKIVPRSKVSDDLWDAALDVIYARDAEQPVELKDGSETTDPLQVFIDRFADDAAEVSMKQDLSTLPLEERLQKHIIDGEKKGLTETLDEALEPYSPLDIINDHLLAGMKVVGELFGSGQMQLPFVLQSAEVMKMAVAHLEPHMEKVEGSTKGKIVLATVKGDVHDIGKNLVDIILTNNGYTVFNIGIKRPIGDILKAYEEHAADAIGMSGLLVKSVNVMEENLKEMVAQGVDVPVLLGGAALSQHYCNSYLRNIYAEGGGKVYHGKDAFEGLRLMDCIMEGRTDELDTEIEAKLAKRAEAQEKVAAARAKEADAEPAPAGDGGDAGGVAVAVKPTRSAVATDVPVPQPPFLGSRLVERVPIDEIVPYVNRIALYRGQWQFKKGRLSDAEYDRLITDTVDPLFDELVQRDKDEDLLHPSVVYGYFRCQSNGNDLVLFDPDDDDREIERFTFPRQDGKKHLCISDFFRPVGSGEKDVIAMTCVTVGPRVSVVARELFESDQYKDYLYLHGFGVECAEALAEYWHKKVREELGIAGDDADETKKLFTQGYRGSRYSFGYPACPDLSDEDKLFRLIDPGRIGVTLTETHEMEPEQTTSAIIVHHPEAKYFSV